MLYAGELRNDTICLYDLGTSNEVANAFVENFPNIMIVHVKTKCTSVEDAIAWVSLFTQKLEPIAEKLKKPLAFHAGDSILDLAIERLFPDAKRQQAIV